MNESNDLGGALNSDEDLARFLKAAGSFQSQFIELIMSGVDFNISLEVRGNDGKVGHCRVKRDSWDRPAAKNGAHSLDE